MVDQYLLGYVHKHLDGLGIGWSKDEYQDANILFSNKGKRANEFIQALKKLWTEDVVDFKGEYHNIPASKIGSQASPETKYTIYLDGFSPNTLQE